MRWQPKKYDNFVEDPTEKVDAQTLITMMRMAYSAAPGKQVCGSAYVKIHDMVNATARKGWVDYSRTGGPRYQAFELVDNNPEEHKRVSAVYFMFDPSVGWWIARDA